MGLDSIDYDFDDEKYTLSELLDGMKEDDMHHDKSFENIPPVGKESL